MDSLHHDVNGRIEELLGRFRIKVSDQLRRVFDIGKTDRDLFAFTFEGTAGGEDFFREMLRRIDLLYLQA